MKSFGFFGDPAMTRFCGHLTAILDGPASSERKIKAVASQVELFLTSRSYATAKERSQRLEKARYRVPYPVYVKIQLNNADWYLVSPYNAENDVLPTGDLSKFEISNGLSLVVEGAENLFKKSPDLKTLCKSCASYLSECIGPFNSLNTEPSSPTGNSTKVFLKEPPKFGTHERRFICWKPMAEAFELLGKEFEPDVEQQFRLRWAWISNGLHPKTSLPYIYLHAVDENGMPDDSEQREVFPRILNVDGSEGMIHGVLAHNSPQLLWNYAHNRKWDLPTSIKEEFMSNAMADQRPHLMYIPVLDTNRIAAQITFGPNDDLEKLHAAGRRLVNLAPVALVSGFQELVFHSLLNLFRESPSFNRKNARTQSLDLSDMRNLLEFVVESCPIPTMKVIESEASLLAFAPVSSACPIVNTFASHGNSAIEQAIENHKSESQAIGYKKFGSTMMTVVHTHRRPLQNMQSFVDEVSAFSALPEDFVERTRGMITFLKKTEVFIDLDVKAHESVFEPEKSPASSSATAEDILRVLKSVKYDPVGLSLNETARVPKTLTISDPMNQQHVAIKWETQARYAAPAAPLALVIAELIDNASKYLNDASQLTKVAWVDVSLRASDILVANDIVQGDKDRVEKKLAKARDDFGRSLNRAKQWAEMVGFEVTAKFPNSTRLEFIVSPI